MEAACGNLSQLGLSDTTASTEFLVTTATTAPTPTQPLSVENNTPSNDHISRDDVLQRLSRALLRKSLTKINISQRGLRPSDARLISMAISQNSQLVCLKLGYNNLGDAGMADLVEGIANHTKLQSLDLGFNSIGDVGCRLLFQALNSSRSSSGVSSSQLRTLYLAGNNIGEAGAVEIGNIVKMGSLRKLYLTGNRIGPDGVRAVAESLLDVEYRRSNAGNATSSSILSSSATSQVIPATTASVSSIDGVQELFLGGTGMGVVGCSAIARLLAGSSTLRVLSLPNCDLGDTELDVLSASILSNRERLPLESLQLSFNRFSSLGVKSLTNALWDVVGLKELVLDNNQICDIGAGLLAALLPRLSHLETLNLGFNRLKSRGIVTLMKTMPEMKTLRDLSICGNTVDTDAAKAIACALAFNGSIDRVSLVRCAISHDAQRHIAAGIVSNRQISLRHLSGFSLGPIVVTLGFPEEIGQWYNDRVLEFVHRMWSTQEDATPEPEDVDAEVIADPLHLLNGGGVNTTVGRSVPLDAAVVVDAAKKAYRQVTASGIQLPMRLDNQHPDSPLDESCLVEYEYTGASGLAAEPGCLHTRAQSFIAPLESSHVDCTPNQTRKSLLSQWVSTNRDQFHKLSQQPFSSKELWVLHNHYFSPVVNECGGSVRSPNGLSEQMNLMPPSIPEVSHASSSENPAETSSDSSSSEEESFVSTGGTSPNAVSSLPVLKRKVSYRFLGDAAASAPAFPDKQHEKDRRKELKQDQSVSILIENGPSGHTMPPKTKRARRNRTRISFLPRIKEKLDSSLDVCHERSLLTMRQLYFIEKSLLSGQIYPEIVAGSRFHLSGELATDAETILVDMI